MGIIDEGKETISEGKQMSNATSDLALIAAAQRAEHYEISGYGSVKTMAEELGQNRVVSLLEQTESEEKQVDQLLTNLAEPMYKQAGM